MATNIQNFYKNKTIFITGSTGFLGKALVEKLLRSCSELNKIILTIRPQKKISAEERILEYFNDTLFDSIKNDKPDILNKVEFLISNLEDKYCGLNNADYSFVKSSVNILFHCAANVGFNSTLKDAIINNIIVTKNVIEIAKNMEYLQAFIHVSTCFVNGYMKESKEKVVNLTYTPEFFINLVQNSNEEFFSKVSSILLENWPNTYILTKNVAEYQIEREKDNLPVAIFRSPGVMPSYYEPYPGWINSQQAGVLLGIGLATGTVKVLYTDLHYKMDIVPVDLIVNCMIAVAWKRALQNRNEELKVYNYSCDSNPILRKQYYDAFTNTPYPLENTIWTPGYVATNNEWLFYKYVTIYQTLPAIIYDTFLKIFRQKPIFEKFMEKYYQLIGAMMCFLSRDYKFESTNVPALWSLLSNDDQKLFNFDINSIDWDNYLNVCTKSVKTLLKEDFNNLDKCHERRYLLRCKY